MSQSREITWEQLTQHNTEEKGVWVAVHDKVYDITKFLDSHPGGREFLLLSAGRDITDLLISYHPFTDKPLAVLRAYEIGTLVNREYPRFKPDTGFYSACRDKVGDYFKSNKINYKEPFGAIWRMSLLLAIYIFAYLSQFTSLFDVMFIAPLFAMDSFMYNFAWWAHRFVWAVLLGWSQMMFLLHIYHDSSHSAWGNTEAWWKFGGRIFAETFVGTCMVSWQNQHVVGHHIYTSIYNLDPDVPMQADGDLRLVVPQQRNNWVYKYQHIYLLALYCLLSFKNRVQDFDIFLREKDGPITVNPITPTQWARVIMSKVIHFTLRLIMPIAILGWQRAVILYIIAELVGGGYLAFNFQVSHVSHYAEVPVARAIPASTSFPVNNLVKDEHHIAQFDVQKTPFATGDERTQSDTHCRNALGVSEASQEELLWDITWAEHQCRTSVDYAYTSPLCTFMTGALNYQTVHHLFPSVSQYHYPAIAKIIRQVAKDFNVRFNYVPTFYEAVMGHIDFLRMMGERGLLQLEVPEMA